jgi:DNA-binding MurR/RpiR family transcriptional regulator
LEELVQAHLQNELGNLVATYKALNTATLRTIAQRIARARRIVLFGFRHGQGPVQAMRRMLVHVRPDVQLLPLAGETLAEYLCNLGPQDLAISVDLRRRSAQMLPIARSLAQMGTPLLYITDVIAGESAKHAQWVIRCHTGGTMLFDSSAAVGGVSNLLCSLAARELARGNAAYLETIERLHVQLAELE